MDSRCFKTWAPKSLWNLSKCFRNWVWRGTTRSLETWVFRYFSPVTLKASVEHLYSVKGKNIGARIWQPWTKSFSKNLQFFQLRCWSLQIWHRCTIWRPVPQWSDAWLFKFGSQGLDKFVLCLRWANNSKNQQHPSWKWEGCVFVSWLRMDGEGTYRFANGRVYVGQWAMGHMSGHGKMEMPDGSRYEGGYEAWHWRHKKPYGNEPPFRPKWNKKTNKHRKKTKKSKNQTKRDSMATSSHI